MDRIVVVVMWLAMIGFWGVMLWAVLTIARTLIRISATLEQLKNGLIARSDIGPVTAEDAES